MASRADERGLRASSSLRGNVLILGGGRASDLVQALLTTARTSFSVERRREPSDPPTVAPDCVLLEAEGPLPDVLDRIAATRADHPSASTVTVSLYDHPELAERAIQSGADSHVVAEELDVTRLARTITTSIQRGQHQREVESLLEQQAAANEHLRTLAHMKDEFVAIASHELRTPVTVIQGFLELLSTRWDRLDDETRQSMVLHAYRNARRLAEMTDDLIVMASVDKSDDRRVKRVPFGLWNVVWEAVEMSQLRLEQVAVDVPVDHVAIGDPILVRRMVRNYLDNAAKHGAPPVHVTSTAVDARVELRVRDHGAGVPEAFVPHLFDRFTQAASSSTREAPGTGLGLAIVRGMARTLSGDAWYERGAPGAVFAVSLPLGDPPAEDETVLQLDLDPDPTTDEG